MKLVRYYVISLLIGSIGLVAGEDLRYETVEQALEALSDPDFQVREDASQFLWGNASSSFLEQYANAEDPEVRHRIRKIQQDVKSGIRPDTSDEVKKLVQRFHDADRDGKQRVMERLEELQAYEQIFSIYHYLEDQPLRASLSHLLERSVRPAVESCLAQDEPDRALKLLDRTDPSPASGRLWAALINYYGDPKKSLEQLRTGEMELGSMEQFRYSALLQAGGHMREAELHAAAVNDQAFLAGRALQAGDFQTYLEWWKNVHQDSGVRLDYLDALEHRIKGNWKHAQDAYPVLISGSRPESVIHLVSIGRPNAAFDLLERKEKLGALEYLSGRGRYQEIFDFYDLPYGELVPDEWIKKNIETEDDAWWFETNQLGLDQVALIYQSLGDQESALKMFAPLWRQVEDDADRRDEFLIQVSETGFLEISLHFAEQVLDDDTDHYSSLYLGNGDLYQYLWGLVQEKFGNKSFSHQIKIILSAVSGVIKGGEIHTDVMALLESVEQDCRANPESRKKEQYLAVLYQTIGDKNKVLRYLEDKLLKQPTRESQQQLLIQYIFLDKWQEAAQLIGQLDNTDLENEYILDAHKAGVLERAGQAEQAEKVLQSAYTKTLDDTHMLYSVSGKFLDLGLTERALEFAQHGMNVTNPAENRGYSWKNLLDRMRIISKRQEQYKQAALYGEARLLYALQAAYRSKGRILGEGGRKFLDNVSKIRFETDLMWGLHYAKDAKNRKLARAYFEQMALEWDGNGLLADDLYPALRELGYNDILANSIDRGLGRLEQTIELYPKAYNLRNTASWLASRAVMRIDLAQTYMLTALEYEPRNAAYLDTIAEVYFASGDREKALEYSLKAWQDSQLSQDAEMIKQQYFHFRDDPLPE